MGMALPTPAMNMKPKDLGPLTPRRTPEDPLKTQRKSLKWHGTGLDSQVIENKGLVVH
jgi:hypothetical protein